MHIDHTHLSTEQRVVAIQRLTALWAFSESGLGGIMHALQIPFTGLVVGGMSVIMISFIAQLSAGQYREILKSLLIVLIIKAMVSPHTPFPAYIAVSFQALTGFALFSLLRVNFVSILLLGIITMLESAIQQLLILTLFFGLSIWKAIDAFVASVFSQFNMVVINSSQWVVGIYLLIYIIGGVVIAWMTWRTLSGFSPAVKGLNNDIAFNNEFYIAAKRDKKNGVRKLWVAASLLILLSVILFFIAADTKQGWIAVAKTISWTLSVIMLWYLLINPVLIKLIKHALQKKEGRYSEEVSRTLSFLPVLRQLAAGAWQKSKTHRGIGRWYAFLSTLIHWSLTYNDQPAGSRGPVAETAFK